jgi:hypothetical protein
VALTGTFQSRMDLLAEKVGGEFLVGTVEVDQIYAQYQHEGLDLNHPRGGQAKYLTVPLVHNRNAFLTQVAKTVLDDGGVRGMCIAMEHLAGGTSHSNTAIRGLAGGALGALSRLTDTGGTPTIGESGPPGEWGVAALAPVEFGDLRDSGHPRVFSPSSTIRGDGIPRYDRAPRQRRLTELELRAKARLIPLDPRLIGWIWWHVMGENHPPGRHGGSAVQGAAHLKRPGFRRGL